MRRATLIIAALIALVACSNSPTGEINAAGAVLAAFRDNPPVTRYHELERAGAAAREMQWADQPPITTLLENRQAGYATWLTPAGATLTLQNGVLHSTRALPARLAASEISDSIGLIRARRAGRADRLHSFLDSNGQIVTRTYRCAITPTSDGMSEDCRSLDQSFINTYQLDAAGRVSQSRQWAGPGIGYIMIGAVR
ncbi:YjbF family lipoprotein [Yoonia sp. SS1-5]|uniref:YjbF family lipoprotein n=1 Tax=Yoonia rhodophyticola TaxID=3137370 RepID=A0AAN0MLB4_9RHOB